MMTMKNIIRILVPVLVLGVLAAVAISLLTGPKTMHVSAVFPKTVSLYVGSDVRIMGVSVGKIEKVTPEATGVRVDMTYPQDVKIPVTADAVIISPSIVGDRFVQFTPTYTSGATLPDNATLDITRTAVPLELDDVYQGIDDLTVALGPTGANKNGALSDLLDSTAKNWGGQGAQFHQTIEDIAKLTGTLDDNKDQFFGTARELEGFIGSLAANDKTVRAFNQSLSQVSGLLSGERSELSASLHNLAIALDQVSTFVKDNKEALGRNIKGLDKVVKILVKQRGALDEVLRVGPDALSNLALTYNPQAGTLDTRSNLDNIAGQISSDPALLLCTLLGQAPGGTAACDAIQSALPRTGEFAGKQVVRHARERFDPSLGGLVLPE
jgi:phospholipid/cholesterol/gamma-HCH transport system substrate-binding protein